MQRVMVGLAVAISFLAVSSPAMGAEAGSGGASGDYALDEAAMRASVASRPADEQERAKSALEFVLAMAPKITLKPGGKGEGSFAIPVGDRKGERQTFPLAWEQKQDKVILHQTDKKDAPPVTCTKQGKSLRCNEGSGAMIYVKTA